MSSRGQPHIHLLGGYTFEAAHALEELGEPAIQVLNTFCAAAGENWKMTGVTMDASQLDSVGVDELLEEQFMYPSGDKHVGLTKDGREVATVMLARASQANKVE